MAPPLAPITTEWLLPHAIQTAGKPTRDCTSAAYLPLISWIEGGAKGEGGARAGAVTDGNTKGERGAVSDDNAKGEINISHGTGAGTTRCHSRPQCEKRKQTQLFERYVVQYRAAQGTPTVELTFVLSVPSPPQQSPIPHDITLKRTKTNQTKRNENIRKQIKPSKTKPNEIIIVINILGLCERHRVCPSLLVSTKKKDCYIFRAKV